MTPAETLLWNAVRRNNTWIKIDRQKAVYLEKQESGASTSVIADFYSIENKLIIEVVSGDTEPRDEYELDTKKDELLQQQWYKILRFTETEVTQDIDGVIAKIQTSVSK